MTTPENRIGPHNIQAEQALLGALLINNEAYYRVGELTPEHFYEPLHGRMFEAIGFLIQDGKVANPISLSAYFVGDETIQQIGGPHYIARLVTGAASVLAANDYSQSIIDDWQRRESQFLIDDYRERFADPTIPITETLEELDGHLASVASLKANRKKQFVLKDSIVEAVEHVDAAFERDDGLIGLSSGLKDLDAKLGGLVNSDLIIIAGRPSMGKTSLAVDIGYKVAKRPETGVPVGIFSLEMKAVSLAIRLLANETGLSIDQLRRGNIEREELQNVHSTSEGDISNVPIIIDEAAGINIEIGRAHV